MIPKARKNLHECEYHLNLMLKSQNVEELEINFAAFVSSARNVTFVLQKEFNLDKEFIGWYKVKQNEMQSDELCIFFKDLRNKILKEGINQIVCNTKITKLKSSADLLNRSIGSELIITGKGIYYLVNKGTKQEDLIPAKTTAQIITTISIKNSPNKHLDKKIENNNIIEISKLHYSYLKDLVEEWVGYKQNLSLQKQVQVNIGD